MVIERSTPIIKDNPFNQRLDEAIKGWETASVDILDRIGQKVGQLYKSITCQEIIDDYDSFDSHQPYQSVIWRTHSIERLVKLFADFDSLNSPIVDVIRKLSGDFTKCRDRRTSLEIESNLNLLLGLHLGGHLHHWIEQNLELNTNPELHGRIIYLATGIDNPFIFINDEVKNEAESAYEEVIKVESRLNPLQKETTISRYTTFLNETRYGANCQELNAWGYADQTCKEILSVIDNPSLADKYHQLSPLRQRLISDLMLFCENQKCYPPQVFFIFDRIKNLYPKERDHMKVLSNFYQEHSEGLFEYFGGRLNFVVSGINRIYERADVISKLNKDRGGVYLSLFSGPPSISKREAKLAGCKECITVDVLSDDELKSVKTGGKALLIKNELLPGQMLPGQNPDQVLAADPKTRIKHNHIQAWLPDEHSQVEESVKGKNISVITDKRGSGLYLQGQRKLDYLVWLFRFGQNHPGVIINYDTGVPNWLYVNFVLKRNIDGGFNIEDYLSGLRTEAHDKTYLGHSGSFNSIFARMGDLTIPSYEEILRLIPVDTQKILNNDEINYLYHYSDKIVEAFYYIAFPTYYNFSSEDPIHPFGFSDPDTEDIANYLKTIVSGHHQEGISFLENSKMTIYLKAILRGINPEVFHRIMYLFASKANISVSREGIFYPGLCTALYDRKPKTAYKRLYPPEPPVRSKDRSAGFPPKQETPHIKFFSIEKGLDYIRRQGFEIPPLMIVLFGLNSQREGMQLRKNKYKIGERIIKNTFLHVGPQSNDLRGIDYSTTTIHLREEKIGYSLRSLRIAGVVPCLDGINRIVAITYKETEGGWLAQRFNLSVNGFPDDLLKDNGITEYSNDIVQLPSPYDESLYIAGIVTPAMVKSLTGPNSTFALDLHNPYLPLDYNKPYLSDLKYRGYKPVHFILKLDEDYGSFNLQFDNQPILKFPSRIPKK